MNTKERLALILALVVAILSVVGAVITLFTAPTPAVLASAAIGFLVALLNVLAAVMRMT